MTDEHADKLSRALRAFADGYGRLAGLQDAIRAADRVDRRYPTYLILREIEDVRMMLDEARGHILDVVSGALVAASED